MPVHERDEEKESANLKRCFVHLDNTSRSFAMVIKELHPELLVPVALFYLILRALDTIEDDMTIPIEKKEPLLRDFHNIIEKEGWNFDGNGPDEKDRQLCVEFNVVIEEFLQIKPAYRVIIKDITDKMGNGMADYAKNADLQKFGVQTVKDYDLYCHYVAGLVGEGLTRLFVEAQLANPILLERDYLHDSMGLFLQKTNIIRDIHEDHVDKRYFWPKEIWSKHVDKFEDLLDPNQREKALACSSEMVLNAMEHIPDCLHYLAGLREQSIFNFCAIPQTMAVATLQLVFQNTALFERNVKLPKGETCQIMIESTQNLQMACEVFRKYTRKILQKNNPKDPNFLKISIAGAKAEQFIERMFPSKDPKKIEQSPEEQQALAKRKAEDAESRKDVMYIMLAVFVTLAVISLTMVRWSHQNSILFLFADNDQIGVAWYLGARFDLATESLKKGNLRPPPGGLKGTASSVSSAVSSAVTSVRDEL
jgi:farnesyl-diphosphate farnesyltransferase